MCPEIRRKIRRQVIEIGVLKEVKFLLAVVTALGRERPPGRRDGGTPVDFSLDHEAHQLVEIFRLRIVMEFRGRHGVAARGAALVQLGFLFRVFDGACDDGVRVFDEVIDVLHRHGNIDRMSAGGHSQFFCLLRSGLDDFRRRIFVDFDDVRALRAQLAHGLARLRRAFQGNFEAAAGDQLPHIARGTLSGNRAV